MEVEFNTENHPNWYFEVPTIKVLILGSYPPHEKRWSYDFYYPNNSNPFWDALAAVKGIELKHYRCDAAVKERQQLMIDMKVGVENLGQIIKRKGESAADNDIEIIKFRDILGILERNPELEQIVLPGYSGKSSTYQAFMRYLTLHKIKVEKPKKVEVGAIVEFEYRDKTWKCVLLNSTSPRNGIELEERIEQFNNYIQLS